MNNPIMEGLRVTVIGISTVFIVLIILMVVLYIMKFLFYKEPKKEQKQNVLENTKDTPNITQEADNDELIAVLTAAVAASMNRSTYNLRIKSFKRVDNRAPIWNKVSRSEQISNRL